MCLKMDAEIIYVSAASCRYFKRYFAKGEMAITILQMGNWREMVKGAKRVGYKIE
jgi:hypothetical protein